MKHMKRSKELILRFVLALMLVSLASGCASPAKGAVLQSDKPRLASEATGAETTELVAGNSAFAFDLYQALRQKSDGNLFYSPHSISLALAMTYAGSRGETEQQMAATLHYTLPQEQLHSAFNSLDTTLAGYSDPENEDAFQLNIANAIWGQDGYEFLPHFLDTLAENYGAGLRTVDYINATEAARQTINDWVSDETEEKIQDLIPQGTLDSLVRLVLTNAIYFNGKWVLPFEENNTHDAPFTLLDGSTVTVPMMSQTENLKYGGGDGYQAVELPYRDSSLTMLFILPEIGRFEELEQALSADLVASTSAPRTIRSASLRALSFASAVIFSAVIRVLRRLVSMLLNSFTRSSSWTICSLSLLLSDRTASYSSATVPRNALTSSESSPRIVLRNSCFRISRGVILICLPPIAGPRPVFCFPPVGPLPPRAHHVRFRIFTTPSLSIQSQFFLTASAISWSTAAIMSGDASNPCRLSSRLTGFRTGENMRSSAP